MDDEIDLSAIVSNAEKLTAEREARERAAQEAEQRAHEEAQVRAREKRAEEEREILKKQQEHEDQRRARIASMSPLRRFIVKRKPYVLGVAGVLALALVAALAVGTARWNENARIAAVKASCNPAQLSQIPSDQRQETLKSWIECPSVSAQQAAVDSLDENTPTEEAASLLSAAAMSDSAPIRVLAATREQLPIESLVTLVDDPSERVRQAVAGQERLPIESLITLVDDPSERVRQAVAGQERLPVEYLMILATDSNEDVRSRVAANPNTSQSTLLELSADTSSTVLSHIMNRSELTPEILLALSNDSRTYPCEQLLARNLVLPAANEDSTMRLILENLAMCWHSRDRERLVSILQVWNASIFETLSTDWNRDVRVAVASSVAAPPSVLEKLASDESSSVRSKVATNRRTPPSGLLKLATDPDGDFCRFVFVNRFCD